MNKRKVGRPRAIVLPIVEEMRELLELQIPPRKLLLALGLSDIAIFQSRINLTAEELEHVQIFMDSGGSEALKLMRISYEMIEQATGEIRIQAKKDAEEQRIFIENIAGYR